MFSCLPNKFYNMIKFGKMALDMFITKMYFFILDQIFLSINPFFQTSLSSKRCSYRSPSLTSKITKTFAMIAITITVMILVVFISLILISTLIPIL